MMPSCNNKIFRMWDSKTIFIKQILVTVTIILATGPKEICGKVLIALEGKTAPVNQFAESGTNLPV